MVFRRDLDKILYNMLLINTIQTAVSKNIFWISGIYSNTFSILQGLIGKIRLKLFHSKIVTTRAGAAEAPSILSGKTAILNPLAGNASKLVSCSICKYSRSISTRCAYQKNPDIYVFWLVVLGNTGANSAPLVYTHNFYVLVNQPPGCIGTYTYLVLLT